MSGRVAGCGIRKTTRACVTGAQQNAFWLRHLTKQADGRFRLHVPLTHASIPQNWCVVGVLGVREA